MIDVCSAAIALYTGTYLPSALYDDWATGRRSELRDLYIALLIHQADLYAGSGDSAQAMRILRVVLTNDSCPELATRRLRAIAGADGARAEAIQAYHALEAILGERP